MQQFAITWTSAGNSPDLEVNLQGFMRLPAPSKFMNVSLLHLVIPFDMVEHSSGMMLVCVKGHTPHVCFANDTFYAYTWLIPFTNGGNLKGELVWNPERIEDARYNLRCQFMEKLHVSIKYVTTVPDADFPLTTDHCFCSMEFGVRAQNVY